MLYTVKEVAAMAGVTVKALHHYHKIGLLLPSEVSEAGYRLYGSRELERLQQIMVYKELDLSLEQIARLMAAEGERPAILADQEKLLCARKDRLEAILATLRKTITREGKGEPMNDKELFYGFAKEEDWREALQEQNDYLKANYDTDLLAEQAIDVAGMNEMAAEAAGFMGGIAEALRNGVRHDDESVRSRIGEHLDFLGRQGHATTAEDFAAQSRFFLNDDFHRSMLEGQQTGLAYYMAAAADAYAGRA